jgi:hypothetical protein
MFSSSCIIHLPDALLVRLLVMIGFTAGVRFFHYFMSSEAEMRCIAF